MSTPELIELKMKLQELMDKKYIRVSLSPLGEHMLFVKKNDGTLGICINYRHLNKVTIKNKYPLPQIDDLFDQMKDPKIFSKNELRSRYHQVHIKYEYIHKISFKIWYGNYEFIIVPFNLTNVPSTFMCLMNSFFNQYLDKFMFVFLDDILIYSNNEVEHKGHMRLVLQVLRYHQLYFKFIKCDFYQSKVQYLGHIISN